MKLEEFKDEIIKRLEWMTEGEVEHFTLVLRNAKHIPHPDDNPYDIAHEKVWWLGGNGHINNADFSQSEGVPDGYHMEVKREKQPKDNIVKFSVDYNDVGVVFKSGPGSERTEHRKIWRKINED